MPKSASRCGCNCTTFITLLLIAGGAIAGAILYQDKTGKEIPFIGDLLPNATEATDLIGDTVGDLSDSIRDAWGDLDFDFEDVINADEPDSEGGLGIQDLEYSWNTKSGEGLELTVANALTPDWHDEFDKAMADWNLSPDMTLASSVVDVDLDCKPESGIMKVCNNDYGDVGWKGINEILTQGSTIVSSVAKMNEFYVGQFVNTGGTNIEDERQYTMCHEIGHGFGLPHQDEDFTNADLNSCMDYSMRPGANLIPNEQDFNSLTILYGETQSRRHLRQQQKQQQPLKYETSKYMLDGQQVERHIVYLPA